MTNDTPQRNNQAVAVGVAIVCLAVLAAPAFGELEEKLAGWKATAEVSYVLTGGNQSTSAFSLGANFNWSREKDSLPFKTYILRSSSTTTTRTAVGSEDDFEIVEEKKRSLIAENYVLSGRYDRRISQRLLVQTSLNWDRNKFAGIGSRFLLTAGAGYAFVETAKTKLKADTGLTYTLRKFLGQDYMFFAGFQFDVLFSQKISESASIASQFILDENLKKMSDWRYDWTNSLTASVNRSLALKTSLRLLYAHLPPGQEIPLFEPSGVPTGLAPSVPLMNLDMFFTTSIVINF